MSIVKRFNRAISAFRGKDDLFTTGKSIRGSEVELNYVGMRQGVRWNEYRADQAIKNAYHKSFYLNTCVDAIVEAVAAVPLKAYERSDTGTWEPSPTHALQYLIDSPNPHFTRRMLIERVAGNVVLAGNALWSKIRDGSGTVVELWPLNPDKVTVVPGKDGEFIKEYEYQVGSKKVKLKPQDVVHFKRVNYETLYWGAGQVQIGQRLLDFDSDSLDWNKVAIQNSGVIPGVLGVKQKITDKQLADLREKMRRKRVGMDEAGEDLILGSDITYHRIGSTSQEMDWIESRKLTRQDIAMFMRVPLPMVSIYDDATLANIEQARKIFYLDRIIPFLSNIEDGLTLALVPEFGDPTQLKVAFDYSDIAAIQDNHYEKARTANILVRIGFHPQAVNRRLAMGYHDDEVFEEFLVTDKQAKPVPSVGTEAGTRSESTALAVKGKKAATRTQWIALVKGKISTELMRELEEVLEDSELGVNYAASFFDKWNALSRAAVESISKYYDTSVDYTLVDEMTTRSVQLREHLLRDVYNRGKDNEIAVSKLVSWLFNSWTSDHAGDLASEIVTISMGEDDD